MNINLNTLTCRATRAAALTSTLLALAACGGGGSGSAAPPAATVLALTGTAATGAAIAAGAVEARCATGTGTATSAANGSYTISITGGALPCVLRVTSGSVVLHSVATGSGSSAVANLTPVTELVLARLAGGAPSAFYAAFTGTASATEVQAAADAVVTTLRDGGVDLSAAGNVLSGALVAANGSTAGNAYDQALDALRARLVATSTTLATLTTTVASGSPAAPVSVSNSTVSLPAAQQLQPAATSCAALRSGTYRIMKPMPAAAGQVATGRVTVNATALTVASEGSTTAASTLTAVSGSPCRFVQGSLADLVVSQAGVMVGSSQENGVRRMVILFPEQTHALADLAGDWNKLGWNLNNGSTASGDSATVTINSTGAITSGQYCANMRTCVAAPTTLVVATHAEGGFTLRNTADTWVDRGFAYRSGNGDLMMVSLSSDGSLGLWTRKRTSTLPTLPATATNYFFVGINNLFTATPVSSTNTSTVGEGSNTVTTVDSTANSFTRSSVINFSTGVTRVETVSINSPRDGYSTRRAETVVASDGSSSTVVEFVGLGLRGSGLFAAVLPSSNVLSLSVTRP